MTSSLPLPTDPSRWFQPRRTNLARARAAIATPAQFAAFAGDWASPERGFMAYGAVIDCPACGGTGEVMNFDPTDCIPCNHTGKRRELQVVPEPPTLDVCHAVAADLEGIARAEGLARQAMARLGSWAVPQWPRRLVWVTLPEPLGGVPRGDVPSTDSPYVTLFDDYMRSQAGFSAWSWDGRERFDAGRLVAAHANPATRAASGELSGVHYALEMTLATASLARSLRQSDRKRLPYEPDPSTLEDPFEPLGALLDTGYVLGGWSDAHVELWMPSLALVS